MFRKITTAWAIVAGAALCVMLPGTTAGAASQVHAAAAHAAGSAYAAGSPLRAAAPSRTVTGTPPSAYGCNANTCIEIDGSGTTVVAIYGQTQNPFSYSVKTTGTVYDNGHAIHSFPEVTLNPGGTTTQKWGSPAYDFDSGDQVCVRYSLIAGYPCETIG